MKTAVSVPDEVFESAEHLARHFNMSRSELYSRAVAEFVARYAPDEVTDSFDKVSAAIGGHVDPAIQRAAFRGLERSEW